MLLYYTLSCGQHAFGRSESQIVLNLSKRSPQIIQLNPESDTLIYVLMSYNPTNRPSAEQILQ